MTNGTEVRMNGSCAGGTGAFIDQMATLLKMGPDAVSYTHLFRGCFSTISLKMAENVVLFLYKLLRDMGGQPKAPIGKR